MQIKFISLLLIQAIFFFGLAFAQNEENKILVIPNAYSLWYNRPSIVETSNGFAIGYVTSAGQIRITEIDNRLHIQSSIELHKFAPHGSDHSSPTLTSISFKNNSAGLLACFSNHSSPLLCSTIIGQPLKLIETQLVDNGKATYHNLTHVENEKIILMYTLQEQEEASEEWRKTVIRTSHNNGKTWGSLKQIIGYGPGTYPYSTPINMSTLGNAAFAYSIYNPSKKRREGLFLVLSKDLFETHLQTPIINNNSSNDDVIPYEINWISNNKIAISYTLISIRGLQATSRIAIFNVDENIVESDSQIAEVAMHHYPSGASISKDGRFALYSPPGGGLYLKDLYTQQITSLQDEGSFTTPNFLYLDNTKYIVALKNPKIKTTRDFSADMFIMEFNNF